MKIEIELADLEALKRDLEQSNSHNHELQKRLNSFDEKAIQEKARDAARAMLVDVLQVLFNKIGIDFESSDLTLSENYLAHHLGHNWLESPELEIIIGATLTNKWKQGIVKFIPSVKPR